MKLLLAFVYTCVLATLSHGGNVAFKVCPDEKPIGNIAEVAVFPCDQSPCQLQKGKSYTINVTFTAGGSDPSLTAKVYGIVAGVKVPFPFKQADACAGGISGLNCPLTAGSDYTYTATLYVSKVYPSIKVVVEWKLVNQASDVEFCLETLIEVVD